MKKKTKNVVNFIEGLHNYIINDRSFRKNTSTKSEVEIQREIRPLILDYLEEYFKNKGYKDYKKKAYSSFYWEGQEGNFEKERVPLFGSKNYPDFIITCPYLIAVEYKQSDSGSLVKQGIGQSLMHTLSEDFHYVYLLFHDQNKDKRIEESVNNEGRELYVINRMWKDNNVMVKFV